jgi:hypothetical protein
MLVPRPRQSESTPGYRWCRRSAEGWADSHEPYRRTGATVTIAAKARPRQLLHAVVYDSDNLGRVPLGEVGAVVRSVGSAFQQNLLCKQQAMSGPRLATGPPFLSPQSGMTLIQLVAAISRCNVQWDAVCGAANRDDHGCVRAVSRLEAPMTAE